MKRTLFAIAASVLLAAMPASALGQADTDRVDTLAKSLVELHEAAGLSVSPSGHWAVFEVRRADPEANTYHAEWRLLDLGHRALPTTIADGGEMPFATAPRVQRPQAVWVSLMPRWSPDERGIAYLRRDHAHTQIWRMGVDGAHPQQVTDDAGDVVDFVWSADGRSLIYDAGPSLQEVDAVRDREGRNGFLFDDRFDPITSHAPVRTHGEVADPPCCRVIDVETHRLREASPEEVAHFHAGRPQNDYFGTPGMAAMWTYRNQGDPVVIPSFTGEPQSVRWRKPFADGAAVVLAFSNPGLRGSGAPVQLFSRDSARGAFIPCTAAACTGSLIDAWRTSDGDIVFMRREGWAFTTWAFYRWRPSTGAVRQLSSTLDIWYDCNAADERLVCFTEGPLKPQTLVALDFSSGAIETLYDLNADFDRTSLAPAERLEWRSPLGRPDYGYFLHPPGPRPAGGYPLVIVHYRARGFLRGGTGDFSPIQAYVAAGIAVLSVDRPEDWDLSAREPDDNALERQEWRGLRARRDIYEALETGIDMLVNRGDVNPHRIGISGLSDGAASTAFALNNTNRFRAASISGGAYEPLSFYLTSSGVRDFYTTLGMGRPGTPDDLNWNGLSMARNAAHIQTPLLIQSADAELDMDLEPFVELQARGKPVEAYVFPDEYHHPLWPAHRLAMYRRNLDWFQFWLLDYEDPAPEKRAQYERWRAMRPAVH